MADDMANDMAVTAALVSVITNAVGILETVNARLRAETADVIAETQAKTAQVQSLGEAMSAYTEVFERVKAYAAELTAKRLGFDYQAACISLREDVLRIIHGPDVVDGRTIRERLDDALNRASDAGAKGPPS